VATTPAAVRLAEKHGLDLPIVRAVHRVIQGEISPKDAMIELMTLPLGVEVELQPSKT